MKVFALAILLVSIYCMEGAIVKREAEGQAQVPAQLPAQLTELGQTIQRYLQTASEYVSKEVVQQERLDELRAQAGIYFQQAREQLDPAVTQLREGFLQFFNSVVEAAKKQVQ